MTEGVRERMVALQPGLHSGMNLNKAVTQGKLGDQVTPRSTSRSTRTDQQALRINAASPERLRPGPISSAEDLGISSVDEDL
jgi:hypothetical protein